MDPTTRVRKREEELPDEPNAKRRKPNPPDFQVGEAAAQIFSQAPNYCQPQFPSIYPRLQPEEVNFSNFVPLLPSVLPIVEPSAPPLEPTSKQIETRQALQQEFCVSCDINSLKMLSDPFILSEKDFVKTSNGQLAQKKLSPFVLRPKNIELFQKEMSELLLQDIEDEKQRCGHSSLESSLIKQGGGNLMAGIDKRAQEMASGICGDFQLVGVFFNRETPAKTLKKEFMRMEAISVLTDGRIQHGKARVYNNFEELKIAWGLDCFLYDAYIKQQSDAQDEVAAANILLQAPLDCFLIWKNACQNTRFVSLRQGQNVTSFEIQFRDGDYFLVHRDTTAIKVPGELFTFLSNTFHVSLYKPIVALINRVALYLDLDNNGHELKRLLDLRSFHDPIINKEYFTISQDGGELFMKTYTLLHNGASYGWDEQSYAVSAAPNNTLIITNKATQKTKAFETVADFMDYLQKGQSVKNLEIAREKKERESRKIQTIIQQITEDAKNSGCFRDFPFQIENELKAYWMILGDACSRKGLITKDPHQDSFILGYMDNKGALKKILFTVTPEGVRVDNTMSSSLKAIFGTILPLAACDIALKQSREALLDAALQTPAFAPINVKEELMSWAAVLSIISPKTYAICEKSDSQGTRQMHLLYVGDNREVQDVQIPTRDFLYQFQDKSGQELEKALCRSALQKTPSIVLGAPFTTVRKTLEQPLSGFATKCKEMQEMNQFVHFNFEDTEKAFQRVRQFFCASCDIMKDSFLIRPFQTGQRGGYVISIGRQNKTEHYEIIINPITGKYHLQNAAAFDSILTLLSHLNLGKSYNDVLQLKQSCELKEQELRKGPLANYIEAANQGNFELNQSCMKPANRFLGRPIIKARMVPGSYTVTFKNSHATYLCKSAEEIVKELS